MKTEIPKFFGLTVNGLLAGAFLYGLLNVVPTFYEVPMNVHLTYRTQLMHHNSISMPLLMLASIISPIWYAFTYKTVRIVVLVSLLSASLALTALLVTRFGNVPINQVIKTWSTAQLPSNSTMLLEEWGRYNLMRVLASLGSFLAFITATHFAFLKDREQQCH